MVAGEIAVEVGGHGIFLVAFFHDNGSDDRFAVGIDYTSAHKRVLLAA